MVKQEWLQTMPEGFQRVTDIEARDILRRRCYEEVTEWLDALGIEPWADSQVHRR